MHLFIKFMDHLGDFSGVNSSLKLLRIYGQKKYYFCSSFMTAPNAIICSHCSCNSCPNFIVLLFYFRKFGCVHSYQTVKYLGLVYTNFCNNV